MNFEKIRSTAKNEYSDEQWKEIELFILKAHSGGWFDGEGSIYSQIHPNGSIGVQSKVENTYLRGLETFQKLFGGSVRITKKRKEHFKQTWKWVACGDDQRKFLEEIIPYLDDKESQAVYAHSIVTHQKQRGKRKVTPTDKETFRRYYQELRDMKQDSDRLSRSTLDRFNEPELTVRAVGNELELTLSD